MPSTASAASIGVGVPAAELGVVAVHRGLLRPPPLPERRGAVGRRERPHRRVGRDRRQRVDQRAAPRRGRRRPARRLSGTSAGISGRTRSVLRLLDDRRAQSSPRTQCRAGRRRSTPGTSAPARRRRAAVGGVGEALRARARAGRGTACGVHAAAEDYGTGQSSVSGSTRRMSSASLLSGEFTRVLTGYTSSQSSGAGAASPRARRRRRWWDRATCPSRASSSITGMREWIGSSSVVGARGDDHARAHPRVGIVVVGDRGIAPDLPQPGERHRLAVASVHEVRLTRRPLASTCSSTAATRRTRRRARCSAGARTRACTPPSR